MENTDITTPKETEKKLDEDSSYRIVYIDGKNKARAAKTGR